MFFGLCVDSSSTSTTSAGLLLEENLREEVLLVGSGCSATTGSDEEPAAADALPLNPLLPVLVDWLLVLRGVLGSSAGALDDGVGYTCTTFGDPPCNWNNQIIQNIIFFRVQEQYLHHCILGNNSKTQAFKSYNLRSWQMHNLKTAKNGE